jgi:hypothetical protein
MDFPAVVLCKNTITQPTGTMFRAGSEVFLCNKNILNSEGR